MPNTSTKQLHIHDFSIEEIAPFIASLRASDKMADCMLVPGAGKAQELTQQRMHAKLVEARAAVAEGEPVRLAASDQPSGLHLFMPLDCQTLDDWLRPQIPDLPPIGSYAVVQPPRNPDVALRVRWEE